MFVGLGNPGTQYRGTRHNIGFAVAAELVGRFRAGATGRECSSLITPVRVAGAESIVVCPQTYMNESGVSVAGLSGRLGMLASEILLIYDDADLPLGRIRIRAQGGAAGHKGVQSILDRLGTNDVKRVRLGIGKHEGRLSERVLASFSNEEVPLVQSMVDKAADAVEAVVQHGISIAMNRFNNRDDNPG